MKESKFKKYRAHLPGVLAQESVKTWERLLTTAIYPTVFGCYDQVGNVIDRERRDKLLQYMAAFGMENALDAKNSMHVFLPNAEFCDQLVDCAGGVKPRYIDWLDRCMHGKVGCVRLPAGSPRASFMFHVLGDNSALRVGADPRLRGWDRDAVMLVFSADSRLNAISYAFEADVDTVAGSEQEWYLRLLTGLGMYVAAHPDDVAGNVPQCLAKTEIRLAIDEPDSRWLSSRVLGLFNKSESDRPIFSLTGRPIRPHERGATKVYYKSPRYCPGVRFTYGNRKGTMVRASAVTVAETFAHA